MTDNLDFSQFDSPAALREWAERVNKENRALRTAEEKRRKADLDALLDDYDPRVRTLIPEGADVREWLSSNGDLFPKQKTDPEAPKIEETNVTPEAQAQQSQPIPTEVQQGFQAAEGALAQGTGGAPSEVNASSDALRSALNSGGIDALDRLLAEQGLTGSVNG
jgi:hypothetical protein